MSRASALRVEKVSVRSSCFTTGVPSSDNCNWLIVYSSYSQGRETTEKVLLHSTFSLAHASSSQLSFAGDPARRDSVQTPAACTQEWPLDRHLADRAF